jgi:hypothetical protein
MIKSKRQLPSKKLQRLFEKLSDYQFDLFYEKGSNMVVCDYLSRAEYCSEDQIPNEHSYPEDKTVFVTTRAQAKKQDIEIPGIKDSMKQLEQQESKKRKTVSRIGDLTPITEVSEPESSEAEQSGRETPSIPVDQVSEDGLDKSKFPADLSEIIDPSIIQTEASEAEMVNMPRTSTPVRQLTPEQISGKPSILIDPTQTQVPVTKPDEMRPEELITESIDLKDPEMTPYIRNNTLVGRGVNLPLDDLPVPKSTLIPILEQRTKDQGEMFDTHMPPTGKEFRIPTNLFKDVLKHDITVRRIPNQLELEKFISQVRQRSLRDFTIPLKKQEISQQQRRDPYFKDIWHYLDSGTLPGNSRKARNVKLNAEDYVMVQQVLFKIVENKDQNDYKMVLAIPEESVPYILAMEHDSLFSNHKGISRSYYTIKGKYFIPKLYDKIVQYIKTCATCQMRKLPNANTEQYEYLPRVNATLKVFDELHMDIKYLAESTEGFKFLLVIVDQGTRFCLAFPLRRVTAAAVAEVLLQKVCLFFGPFSTITFDEGRENANRIMAYLTRALGIQMRFVAVQFHQSNLSERYIKSVTDLLVSRLKGHGRMWPMYINSVTYSLNTAQHSILRGFSSFELLFGRRPKDFLNLELDTGLDLIPISYRDYAQSIKNRLQEVGKLAQDLQNEYQEKQRLDRSQKVKISAPYAIGDLCWLLMPSHSELNTNTRKIKANYIGPLMISDVIDERNCCLKDLQGRSLHGIFNIKRLKRAFFRTSSGTASNINQVKSAIEIMDAQKVDIPDLKVEARGLMCMADNSQPTPHDLNHYQLADTGQNDLSPYYNMQLASYLTHNEGSNVAINRKRKPRQIKRDKKREMKMPRQDEEMIITKGKFKLGELHLFCRTDNGYGIWFHISCFGDTKNPGLQATPAINSDKQPTGRICVNFSGDPAKVDKQIRVQGSRLKFARQLCAKPSLDEHPKHVRVKKVRFNLTREEFD